MKGLAVMLFGLLAACASSSAATREPATEPKMTGVVTATPTDPRVAQLQVVVGELLDRIEILNARVAKLESGAPPPRVQQLRAEAAAPLPEQTVNKPAPRAVAPVQKQPATRTAASPGQALGDQYRSALELYGKGRLDDSRLLFQAVFDADPAGDLADNALYWVGETYFATGKYNDALRFYGKLTADYGDQNKAPDAMLKIGLSQEKLGDLDLARKTFEALIAKYSYSTAAAAAKYELTRIKY